MNRCVILLIQIENMLTRNESQVALVALAPLICRISSNFFKLSPNQKFLFSLDDLGNAAPDPCIGWNVSTTNECSSSDKCCNETSTKEAPTRMEQSPLTGVEADCGRAIRRGDVAFEAHCSTPLLTPWLQRSSAVGAHPACWCEVCAFAAHLHAMPCKTICG